MWVSSRQAKNSAQPAFTQTILSLEFSSAKLVLKNVVFLLHSLFPYSTWKGIFGFLPVIISYPFLFVLLMVCYYLLPSFLFISLKSLKKYVVQFGNSAVLSWKLLTTIPWLLKEKKKRWRSICARKKNHQKTLPFLPSSSLHMKFMR